MTTLQESIQDLRTILRHIDILATSDLDKITDIEELKYYLRQWASEARDRGHDALAPIEALNEAIVDGVDITTLQEYRDVKEYARSS